MHAIETTIVRFRRGEVQDRSAAFAPSVAEFVSEVRATQERIDIAAFWDKTDFIEFDSPEWRVLCRQRGRSMPQIERKGKLGWYVPKDEVAALPPLLLHQEQLMIDELDRKAARIAAPQLKQIGSGQ